MENERGSEREAGWRRAESRRAIVHITYYGFSFVVMEQQHVL